MRDWAAEPGWAKIDNSATGMLPTWGQITLRTSAMWTMVAKARSTHRTVLWRLRCRCGQAPSRLYHLHTLIRTPNLNSKCKEWKVRFPEGQKLGSSNNYESYHKWVFSVRIPRFLINLKMCQHTGAEAKVCLCMLGSEDFSLQSLYCFTLTYLADDLNQMALKRKVYQATIWFLKGTTIFYLFTQLTTAGA